jgi:hypothetical protein
MMAKLDSKNVKRLNTNEAVIKSLNGETYINGPVLEMRDTTQLRLKQGLDTSSNEFLFELYNEAGTKTISIDSAGKGVFNQVTLRNDLSGGGGSYINIDPTGMVAYNGSVKTIEVSSTGAATFKQVTLRNDLTGSAYINIDTNGMVAYNGSVKTVEVSSTGAATFKQVTLRNDLTGAAYINIDTSGFVAYNGSVKTVEISSAGAATFKQVTLRNDMTGSNYINIDTGGIYAWDNALSLKTFEIDSSGKAYFRGDITSDATITGATFKTAASGERIEISGNKLISYNSSNHKNGLVIENTGSRFGDCYFYDDGTKVLELYNNLTGSGYTIRPVNGAWLYLGTGGATTQPQGTWDFQGSTISNLLTSSNGAHDHGGATGGFGAHDHGIPSGTVLMVSGGGTVTFTSESNHWHSISSDGSHTHNVSAAP